MNATGSDRRRKIALWILIPATVLFLISLVPVGMMIVLSPMVFDSGQTPARWTFVITLWIYPVVVLITIVAAWICFAVRAHRLATWLNVLPIIHLGVLAVELAKS